MVRALSNCRGMDDVISLSSDSDEDDSDVEFIGHYRNLVTNTDPLPLSAVKIHVRTVSLAIFALTWLAVTSVSCLCLYVASSRGRTHVTFFRRDPCSDACSWLID